MYEWGAKMKRFLVEFKRVEDVHFYIEGESKKEVKEKIKNCEWELGEEQVDNITNKNFHIEECKNE